MKKVIVIGAGPAGMFAALAAAGCGHSVTLLEKNEKLGKKLFITGKGRCNITNAADMETLISNIVTNRRFLYSAFYACDNVRVIDFFERQGLKTKTERGGRVFPASDHSSDVIAALKRALKQAGVAVRLLTRVSELLIEDGCAAGVRLDNGRKLLADAVVLATGGRSYPSTGSTGDGYLFARQCGHSVTKLRPALVPFTAAESYVTEMQGLSLKNVNVTIHSGKKIVFDDFGEMLFTHFGVSGPLMLAASSVVGTELSKHKLAMTIDLKPALSEDQLDRRILRDFEQNQNNQYKNSMRGLLPAKMIPVFLKLTGIGMDKKVNEITKQERKQMIAILKEFPLTLTGVRDFDEAIITQGGVCVREVNPSTMESKLVKGLYFAGEILDLDGFTGGYNLQIAWSTGHLAGSSIEGSMLK